MRHIKGQATYDSMCPPDDDEIICSPSDCADCNLATLYGACSIGSYKFITADDLAEAKDELDIERLEEVINVDTIADRLRKELAEIEGGEK